MPIGSVIAPGRPHIVAARSIISSIENAVSLTLQGITAAVVTNPIAKSVLYEAGFKFPGHTEFLADLAQRATGKDCRPVMMLAGPKLRAIPDVRDVKVELVWEPPWDRSRMSEAAHLALGFDLPPRNIVPTERLRS